MREFVLRRRKRWVARAFGRNLLLRWTDRVEACVILAAMLLALGVCAVSVAQGGAVYRSHAQLYAAQARMRHMVTATVAATGTRHTSRTPPHRWSWQRGHAPRTAPAGANCTSSGRSGSPRTVRSPTVIRSTSGSMMPARRLIHRHH